MQNVLQKMQCGINPPSSKCLIRRILYHFSGNQPGGCFACLIYFLKHEAQMHFYPKKKKKPTTKNPKQFLLLSDSFIKPKKTTTALQTRTLICFGLPSPYFRVTVNITPVIATHLNRQPFIIFRCNCTSLQHCSLLPQSAGPLVWLCIARPLAKL